MVKMIFLFMVVMIGLGVAAEYDSDDAYIPKYLQKQYSGLGNGNLGYSGEKKSQSKTSQKSGHKSNFVPYTNTKPSTYSGGCLIPPQTPLNSAMRCSKFTGCRLDCAPNHHLPDKSIHAVVICEEGKWKVDGTDWDHIPACEPICLPDCQNNGICVAPNQCNCPKNFIGPQCQYEDRPCLNFPPPPMNSKRSCRSTSCSVQCLDGHQFPDGSTITNLVCKNGNWVPTKEMWVTVPDCQPTCNPPCQNGGNCLSFNVCQCPQDYRGSQCQFNSDNCNVHKLQFNGGYKCSGDTDNFQCTLSCPEGSPFEFQPADIYTCSYATGIFLPQPIPQCIYAMNMNVMPSGHEYDFYNQHSGAEMYEHSFSHKKVVQTESYQNDSNINNVHGGSYSHHANQFIVLEEKIPEPGVCFTWAGTHYKTFDGKVFSFQSDCAHIMVQDRIDNAFTIIVQNNKECQMKPNLCYRSIKVFYQDKQYILKTSELGLPILTTPQKILAIPGHYPGVRAEWLGHFVLISLDAVSAVIKWDGKYFVQIEVKENLWNRTTGLCGTIDGNIENDLQVKDGTVTKNTIVLATNWQVNTVDDICLSTPTEEQACAEAGPVKTMQAMEFCKKLLSDKRFAACFKVLDVTVLLDACRWDYCSCSQLDSTQCACETMSVYVKECIHKGVTALAKWRDDKVCPMICSNGKVYLPCGPVKGQSVCGSNTELFDEKTCYEGCYCPDGTVLHETKCITRDMCPCRLRGKDFPPGFSVPKDCNTCTCVEGQWVCTQLNCGARCSAIGDPHYTTFDGKRYDFMGQCSYYLIKAENFSIEAENVACAGSISQAMNFPISMSSGLPSCTKTVTIKSAFFNIKLKQNHEVVVNGNDVTSIPYDLPGVSIRSASSIFMQVELQNGVLVWWDGLTRVYIDVPATFIGNTKGLCGTFNNNQKDDFLTPEDDVELSVIPFANKWKTIEKCHDMPAEMQNNPCDLNIQNKESALNYCSKLKSELFKDCHFFVDSEPLYLNCLYDMCSCETKISNCFCPIIASYAQECALLGVKIDWRNQVRECGVQCSGGQKYQVCGNSCTRTCSDIASRPDCKPVCVEGCNCPEGQTLDETGECVPIGTCKCRHDGVDFPPGYQEIRSATKSPEICTCVNAGWSCKPASPMEISDLPKQTDVKEKCNSRHNLVFTSCENPEPLTCKNMHTGEPEPAIICHAGCQCKVGYVLDTTTKKCVLPSECPCHHGGRSYAENSTVQIECNTCFCKNGKWKCTDRLCSAECSTWGDSHFKTFDGKLYDYQGQCDYLLAKGFISLENSFDVIIQSVPCGALGVSCSKSVIIKVGFGPNQDNLVLIQHKKISDDKKFKNLNVREKGLYVIVEVPDFGMSVKWDKGTRVYVQVDPRWKNKLKGLCGNYNDNELDDFQTPSGGIAEVSTNVFGDSWRLQPYCPDSIEVTNTCEDRPDRKVWAIKQCGLLKSPLFSRCHSEVQIDAYFEKCVFDACACDQGGDCECLCTALATYAQECNNHGVALKWRSQELCPMQCDETYSTYSPCISTCPIETCATIKQNTQNKMCKEDNCIEGCEVKRCPEDHVYQNSSLLQCVPRNSCKVLCMEIDGVVYWEGDLMEEDECYSCYCSRGKKLCKGQQCTSLVTEIPLLKTTLQRNEEVLCVDGWSEWINQDTVLDKSKVTQKLTEIEPLPSSLVMFKIKSGGKCTTKDMKDIECRTVESKISAKSTGMNVECSLETGLICRESAETKGCPDFEIRVLCQCDEPATIPPKIINPKPADCILNAQTPHPSDCHLFYHCTMGIRGLELVEKSCGPSMMFNPQSQVCDWPNSVLILKPDCDEFPILPVTAPPPLEVTKPTSESHQKVSDKCPVGQTFNTCLFNCRKMCNYFLYKIQKSGLCKYGQECEEGCENSEKNIQCLPGLVWANNETCVSLSDCVCASHIGQPVKPGFVYRESDCEICQCVDNYYTCKMECLTEKVPLSTEIVPPINPLQLLPTSVTPPLECNKNNYINLVEEMLLPDSAFLASSSLNSHFEPQFARITSKTPFNSGGSWSPAVLDKTQFLQITLEQSEPIYGVIVMGSPIYNEYVTSYYVLYDDGNSGFKYVLDTNGKKKKFSGSIDPVIPTKEMFDVPIEVKAIRINPQTWHNMIALRVELIGCKTLAPSPNTIIIDKPVCDDPMGVSNGLMADIQIEVSSELSPEYSKEHLKINSNSAWQPLTNSPTEYIQFDFLANRNLTGVLTKGGHHGWVKAYNLKYSSDNFVWNPMLDDSSREKLFIGNHDQDTPQVNHFDLPISARYLKLQPILWYENIQMRVEPFGCFEPYDELKLIVPTPTKPNSMCNYCPGIKPLNIELNGCQCKEDLWWDGENCVNRTQCPCVVGIIPYDVGTVYEKEDCSECICKLGGIPHCTPKVCSICPENLRSVVTEKCECLCQPCEGTTKLCPRSGDCIEEKLWCDGVAHCPDDEINCTTTVPPSTTALPVDKCPEQECPQGFKAVMQSSLTAMKYHSYSSPMFNVYVEKKKVGNDWLTRTQVNSGIKGGQKLRIPLPSKSELLNDCPEYHCILTKGPEGTFNGNKTVCSPVTCPIGFIPLYNEEEIISKKERCPLYSCNPPLPPESVCNLTGRTFNTFDQTEFKYDICNHILARDLNAEEWYVSVKKNCTFMCTRNIVIGHEEHLFILHQDLSVEYNGYRYNIEQTKKIGSKSQFFTISRLGDTLLFVSNQFGFWVIWDKQGNVRIGVVKKLKGMVDGLCGFFNELSSDDKRKPDGSLAKTTSEFGDSWIVEREVNQCEPKVCPVHLQNEALNICNEVKDDIFAPCAGAVNLNIFISRCLETTCTCLEAARMNQTLEESCKCNSLQSFVVDCLAADPTIELTDWRLSKDCPAVCEVPFVHHDCFQRRCETTCQTLSVPGSCPKIPHLCFPGCYCPAGLVRAEDTCIKPSECRNCECNLLPHLQYITYDGSNVTVTGNCVYVMSRDEEMRKDGEHKFQVLITNHPCRDKPDKMCVGKVTILYKGHKIHILYDLRRQKLKVIVDGDVLSHLKEIEEWAKVSETPSKHIKFLMLEVKVEVSIYYPSLGVSVKAPSHKYKGKLEGLCGDCNNNMNDDFKTPTGEITDDAEKFGLSWLYDKLPGGQEKENCRNIPAKFCEPPPPDNDPCVQLVDVNIFGQCHPLLDPTMFIDWCHKDTCGALPQNACTSIKSYATECMNYGFCIKWHSQLCPADPCPAGQIYEECSTNCLTTCEQLRHNKKMTTCSNKPRAGCVCPKGKVLMNDTCVDAAACEVCDNEGHHSGETWMKDICTNCTCVGSNLQCQTKQCSAIDTVCDSGFTAVKVAANQEECCDKYVCVPEQRTVPTCEPPQEITCTKDQEMKVVQKSDGCQQFVCQCIPTDQCQDLEETDTSPEPGYEKFVDTSGCCPRAEYKCNKDICPKPEPCEQFYEMLEEKKECCSKYSCKAPYDKCIYEMTYTNDEVGGERLRHKYEKHKMLKHANETWTDGPCRECACTLTSGGNYQSECSKTDCPHLGSSPDNLDYVLMNVPVPNRCCPDFKRIACKHMGKTYTVGEKWHNGTDWCTSLKCVDGANGLDKQIMTMKCEKNCNLGWEYKEPEMGSMECCGACRPVACVIDGMVRRVGEQWTSENFCTKYKCVDINGSLSIQSVLENCQPIPADLLNNYVYEIKKEERECCTKHTVVACKYGDRRYEVGEIWSSDTDKCKTFVCIRNENGDVVKQESVETCKTDCKKGFTYRESPTSCCGECIQTACLVENQIKTPGTNWTSPDNCTIFMCESYNEFPTVTSSRVSCPDITGCPITNTYMEGCCALCNASLTSECAPVEVDYEKSMGLVKEMKFSHGDCWNREFVHGFTECVGGCKSATLFNAKTGQHESVCSCCQAIRYVPILMELECEDGFKFKKQIAVPSECGCKSCSGDTLEKKFTYKKRRGIKT